MMKTIRITLLVFTIVITNYSHAQSVGINNTGAAADPYAIVDMTSTTKGLLIPRMTSAQKHAISSPAQGLLIFQTDTVMFCYYDGAKWVQFDRPTKINDLSDGKSDSDGTNNGSSVFLGLNAGKLDDQTANRNVGLGYDALENNTFGEDNVAAGYKALNKNTTGNKNVGIGHKALLSNMIGYGNVALGDSSLSNATGNHNVAVGKDAFAGLTTGNSNIGIGAFTGNITTGSRNILIGHNVHAPSPTASNQLNIGNLIYGTGLDGLGATTSSGNIGIGTATPSEKLTVKTGNGYGLLHVNSGVAVGSYVNASGGWYGTKNNFNLHLFANGADTARLTVGTNGSVGINNTAPSALYKLDVQGDVRFSPASSNADFIISNAGVEPTFLPSTTNFGYIGSASSRMFHGHFTNITYYGSLTNASDRRIKENIQPLQGALNKVMQLKGKTYDLKKEFVFGDATYGEEKTAVLEASRKNKIGFIAQELEEVFPQLVKTDAQIDLKSVDYISLVPVLVEAIKEQEKLFNQQIAELEKEIAALKNK